MAPGFAVTTAGRRQSVPHGSTSSHSWGRTAVPGDGSVHPPGVIEARLRPDDKNVPEVEGPVDIGIELDDLQRFRGGCVPVQVQRHGRGVGAQYAEVDATLTGARSGREPVTRLQRESGRMPACYSQRIRPTS